MSENIVVEQSVPAHQEETTLDKAFDLLAAMIGNLPVLSRQQALEEFRAQEAPKFN